jgi:adenine-specific DNA-methyltransferase
MSQNLERLKQLLADMFQLDQAELDFGIYRIMNAKRDEITRFLDNDLLPQVREAFQTYEAENRGAVEADTEKDNNRAANGNERRFIYSGLAAEGAEERRV